MRPPQTPFAISQSVTPGTWLLRSADEQGILAAPDAFDRWASDPAFAEDCRSFVESCPFFILWREGTDPIRCECCGTPVFAVPEASTDDELPRRWVRAIWEPETGRKHTLRRCDWQRAQPVIS